ncbi:MAG: hypothetical protein GKC04_09385, partial [Methanomicrobiales archaeon]|nr:hypothetical protein [Methanomicrobiales archaeon]
LADLTEKRRSALLCRLEQLEEEKLATFYALLHSDAIKNLLSAGEHQYLQQLLMAWRTDPDSLTAAEKRAACGLLVELALDIAGEETA